MSEPNDAAMNAVCHATLPLSRTNDDPPTTRAVRSLRLQIEAIEQAIERSNRLIMKYQNEPTEKAAYESGKMKLERRLAELRGLLGHVERQKP